CNRSRSLAPFVEKPPQPSLNRRAPPHSPDRPLVELRKHMARPPGVSFLGSKATQMKVT
ncbi:uncharacterized protein SCHCODRAFT_01042987, partial [Schizophyllum commune H4-8]|uniref:uncharacterized protein n=1 Tax=Schizophyllum commune (strain H4-8 / FGSC 9210) TaxID=578458 RepID=UPI002160A47D